MVTLVQLLRLDVIATSSSVEASLSWLHSSQLSLWCGAAARAPAFDTPLAHFPVLTSSQGSSLRRCFEAPPIFLAPPTVRRPISLCIQLSLTGRMGWFARPPGLATPLAVYQGAHYTSRLTGQELIPPNIRSGMFLPATPLRTVRYRETKI